jgi:hypothetical protein
MKELLMDKYHGYYTHIRLTGMVFETNKWTCDPAKEEAWERITPFVTEEYAALWRMALFHSVLLMKREESILSPRSTRMVGK